MVCDDTRIPEMRNIVRLVMKRRHRHRVHVVGVGTGASPAADQVWGGIASAPGPRSRSSSRETSGRLMQWIS